MEKSAVKVNAWFCYQPNFARKWIPSIYYGERPAQTHEGSSTIIERSSIVQLDEDDLFMYKERSGFAYLVKRYPPPKEKPPEEKVVL